jgi:hypothetical protein
MLMMMSIDNERLSERTENFAVGVAGTGSKRRWKDECDDDSMIIRYQKKEKRSQPGKDGLDGVTVWDDGLVTLRVWLEGHVWNRGETEHLILLQLLESLDSSLTTEKRD